MIPPPDHPSMSGTLAPSPPVSFRLLSDEERHASLQRALSVWNGNTDLWVFGYGSLIWRPEFAYEERREARLHGYHRALCLWSRVNRGTPEQPGLVFGLDKGGSCRGVAFRVAAQQVPATFEALWKREMPSGAYIPRWLNTSTGSGRIPALTFTMNRHASGYVRDLPQEHVVRIVRSAHGRYGPCVEYVLETAQALRAAGIEDQRLEAIVRRLSAAPSEAKGSLALGALG